MSEAIEIGGYGILLPAAISFGVYLLIQRCLPTAVGQRYAAAAAVGLAFIAGYVLLPPWAALVPERHWQWLPCLAAAAMLVGPLAQAVGIISGERWLLHAALSGAAAWLLVPDWGGLEPPRAVWIGLLAGYLWLMITTISALPDRLLGGLFLTLLTALSLVLAATLAIAISLKYGQVAGIAAAAMAGCTLASFLSRQSCAARGVIAMYAVLVGGMAFVGCIEPQRPLVALLLIPAGPLALWLFAGGPLARWTGSVAGALRIVAVLVPPVVAALWILAG